MRVILALLISFTIAFSLFTLTLFFYHYTYKNGGWVFRENNIESLQYNFYSQTFNFTEKKIFILGSSQVWALNATYISESLSKYGEEYEVYNLGIQTDQPRKRLETLDMIIKAKPEIIVYGIAERDFGKLENEPIQVQPFSEHSDLNYIILTYLEPKILFTKIYNTIIDVEIKFLESPKLDLYNFAYHGLENDSNITADYRFIVERNTPFYDFKQLRNILDSSTLEKIGEKTRFVYIDPINRDENLSALKIMIKKFQDNNIKVIIFVTPQQKYILEKKYDSESFYVILNEISKTGLIVYSLWDKYAEMDIWGGLIHVAVNKDALVYSDDITKIIVKEIGK